jgi:hypothetical protein
MNNEFTEGNLTFDFTACGTAERFDEKEKNAYGMKAVDFVAESDDTLYFVEVKDYQHPKSQRKNEDLIMLKEVIRTKEHGFAIQMGTKIKDSLLRRYAEGHSFGKKAIYLLLLNLDLFGETERGLLKAKISGYVPTGLNDVRFNSFTTVSFELVNASQLLQYGIVCAEKSTV